MGPCRYLITATPLTLSSKPNGKISIKVVNDYNKDKSQIIQCGGFKRINRTIKKY